MGITRIGRHLACRAQQADSRNGQGEDRSGYADQRPGKGEQEDRKGDHSTGQHANQGGRGSHQGRHHDEAVAAFCEVCRQRWGITPLQVFIHRDEGHYVIPGDTATWKPNFHAHIVWDWMNHDTGKSCKLNVKDMSDMQTILAECLEMERGTSKKQTGKEHLERTDFIIAKQKQEAEQAQAEKEAAQAERDAAVREADKAKTEQEKLQAENEERQRRRCGT